MLTWLKYPGKTRAGQNQKPLHSSTPWPWLTGTGYMLQPQPFSPSPTGALSSSTGCSPAPRAMGFWLLLVSLHITAEQTGSRRETGKTVCMPVSTQSCTVGNRGALRTQARPRVLYYSAWAEGDIKSCFLPDVRWDLFISHLSFVAFTPSMAPGPSASWTLITTYPAPFCPLA